MISLQVQGLSKRYNRKTILNGLSFIHQEGVLGIAGSNGSGKSTLLKCMAGLLRPESGSIRWEDAGTELPGEGVRSLTGYAAPYINLYDELTVLENLSFLGDLSDAGNDEGFYLQLLENVQMSGFEDRLFKSLSTGQRQRVKLAASLVRSPRILFLDEPGSNLDEKGQSLVQSMVQDQKNEGTLVILASNDPKEISLCDQVIELGSG